MEKEIQEIIEKNLPAHVSEVLRKRLAKADEDALLVKKQLQLLTEKSQTISDQANTIKKYVEFDVANSNLDKREKDVADAERDLKVATLTYQLAA